MLSGEIKALSTGFSEAVAMAKAGEVNIIGVTSDKRVGAFKNAKTMKEQGIDTYFVNWRGFFAAPGLPNDKLEAYKKAINYVAITFANTPEGKQAQKTESEILPKIANSDFIEETDDTSTNFKVVYKFENNRIRRTYLLFSIC